jgi:hypothetical protein
MSIDELGSVSSSKGLDCKSCLYDAIADSVVRFTINGTVVGAARFQWIIADTQGVCFGGTQ